MRCSGAGGGGSSGGGGGALAVVGRVGRHDSAAGTAAPAAREDAAVHALAAVAVRGHGLDAEVRLDGAAAAAPGPPPRTVRIIVVVAISLRLRVHTEVLLRRGALRSSSSSSNNTLLLQTPARGPLAIQLGNETAHLLLVLGGAARHVLELGLEELDAEAGLLGLLGLGIALGPRLAQLRRALPVRALDLEQQARRVRLQVLVRRGREGVAASAASAAAVRVPGCYAGRGRRRPRYRWPRVQRRVDVHVAYLVVELLGTEGVLVAGEAIRQGGEEAEPWGVGGAFRGQLVRRAGPGGLGRRRVRRDVPLIDGRRRGSVEPAREPSGGVLGPVGIAAVPAASADIATDTGPSVSGESHVL